MTPTDRFKAAILTIIREALPNLRFLGRYEYVVRSSTNTTVSAEPVDLTIGLPAIVDAPMCSSVIGGKGTLPPGALVRVMFVNGSPTRPEVVGLDPAAEPILVEIDGVLVKVNGGVLGVARQTDPILAGGIFAGNIVGGSVTVKAGG